VLHGEAVHAPIDLNKVQVQMPSFGDFGAGSGGGFGTLGVGK
jgi:hypothetical protein